MSLGVTSLLLKKRISLKTIEARERQHSTLRQLWRKRNKIGVNPSQ